MRIAKIILINFLVLIFILAGLELFLTFFLNHPTSSPHWLRRPLRLYYHAQDQHIIQYMKSCAHYDENLFYKLNSGEFSYENREYSTHYSVNSMGFRDDEASLDKPRIIVLGDSYTMGWGVEQDETYSSLLEKQLGKKVLNTGMSSYGTVRELKSIQALDMDSLEVLVIQYCPNDFIENRSYLMNDHHLPITAEIYYDSSCTVHGRNTAYYPLKHLMSVPRHFREPVPHPPMPLPEKWEKLSEEEAFLRVLRTATHIPKQTMIVVLNLEAERNDNNFITHLARRLEGEMASSLADRMSLVALEGLINEEDRYILDAHINAQGHARIAEAIAKHIESLPYYTGQRHWLYQKGDTAIICEYVKGLKEGEFKTYWPNGQLSRISHYKSGEKMGRELDFDDQGRLASRKYYQKDELQGWEVRYESNGLVRDSIYHGPHSPAIKALRWDERIGLTIFNKLE